MKNYKFLVECRKTGPQLNKYVNLDDVFIINLQSPKKWTKWIKERSK